MKIGISTASLFPEKHSEEAAEIIKELGAETAEIFLSTFYEYRPEFARALAPKIEGLDINSMHTMPLNFEANFFNSTRRVRGDGFYWLDQVARSAQALKCPNYTFHGFVRAGGAQSDDMGFIGERFSEAYYFARGYNLSLCIENTANYAFNRPDFFTELKSRCKDVYGVFDIKQARRSGYPYQMYIEAMKGAIAYVHLSDVTADGKCCLPDKGIYDFKEIFKRLKGAGFDGNVILEVYRGDFKTFDELKKCMEFLKEIADKV